MLFQYDDNCLLARTQCVSSTSSLRSRLVPGAAVLIVRYHSLDLGVTNTAAVRAGTVTVRAAGSAALRRVGSSAEAA